jgi:hypothetical protein
MLSSMLDPRFKNLKYWSPFWLIVSKGWS